MKQPLQTSRDKFLFESDSHLLRAMPSARVALLPPPGLFLSTHPPAPHSTRRGIGHSYLLGGVLPPSLIGPWHLIMACLGRRKVGSPGVHFQWSRQGNLSPTLVRGYLCTHLLTQLVKYLVTQSGVDGFFPVSFPPILEFLAYFLHSQ